VSFPDRVRDLTPDACRELLLVLTSPSHVHADVIRQFHERGKGRGKTTGGSSSAKRCPGRNRTCARGLGT